MCRHSERTLSASGGDQAITDDKVKLIDRQWKIARPRHWGRSHYSEERLMLHEVLDEWEDIERLTSGTLASDSGRFGPHRGILTATSRRVIFLDRRTSQSDGVFELSYETIQDVSYDIGTVMSEIRIVDQRKGGLCLADIGIKESVRPFVDCLRAHVHADAGRYVRATLEELKETIIANSVADEIEKLARLVERNILTREEFDARKSRLLALFPGTGPAATMVPRPDRPEAHTEL